MVSYKALNTVCKFADTKVQKKYGNEKMGAIREDTPIFNIPK